MLASCRNICRHRSFCASGCPAILLTNTSRPFRRSSMNCSSKIPSSDRNGICSFQAFEGSGGTTICKRRWRLRLWTSSLCAACNRSHLAIPLQLIPQPLEVGISSSHARFFNFEDWKICLKVKNSIEWMSCNQIYSNFSDHHYRLAVVNCVFVATQRHDRTSQSDSVELTTCFSTFDLQPTRDESSATKFQCWNRCNILLHILSYRFHSFGVNAR